jgi:hypothetical protein
LRWLGVLVVLAPTAALAEESSLEPLEIDHMAGTSGDALRAAEALPGFSPPIGTELEPTLRGTGGEDLDWTLFGIELPAPFHASSRRGVVDPAWVDRLTLHPGAPLEIGDATDTVDTTLRAPATDALHGGATVDPVAAGARVEAPLRRGARSSSVGVSVRRTLVDLWGPGRASQPGAPFLVEGPVYGAPVPPSVSSTFSEAPVGWDGLFHGVARLGPQDELRLVLLATDDRTSLALGEPADVDPALTGSARSAASYELGLVRWRVADGAGNASTLTFALSRLADRVTAGPFLHAARTHSEARLREVLHREIDDTLAVEVGAEVALHQSSLVTSGPRPPEEGEVRRPVALGPTLETDFGAQSLEPAGWIATPVAATRAWRIVPGVRVDAYGEGGLAMIDPRVTSVATVDAETTIRGHVGSWSRRPELWRTTPALGTPGLGPQRTAEAALGLDRSIAPFVVSLDGFARSLSGRPIAVADESARGYRLEAEGTGRVLGAGVGVRLPPSPDGWALASYEISTSERDDGPGPARPWSGDRLHSLRAAASLVVGDGWQIGLRFRLASGAPVPRIVGATYDADADAYRPIARGTTRLSTFHELDLRLDRSWAALGGTITVWVDVQNLYDRPNAVGRTCSFDFETCADVRGVPLVPTAGIEGRL